jgi:prevent-host-death family protein
VESLEIEIGAFDAKTRLAELLRDCEQGQVYVIHRRGKPVAKLVPIESADHQQTLGATLKEFHNIRNKVDGRVSVTELIKEGRRY